MSDEQQFDKQGDELPTPLTDAVIQENRNEGHDDFGHYFKLAGVLAKHAQQLERELAEARDDLKDAIADRDRYERIARSASSATRPSIPEVLFDGYAVYKELRSPDASGISIPAEAVAEVLDAVVRLIRREYVKDGGSDG